MPIYEYRCEDCGERFERLIRRSEDRSALVCPACGGAKLATELSLFATHRSSTAGSAGAPMCPAGGPCPTPGACGLS
ncbi:MAG: zinc ribbon domain-containing protein [Bryobacterales bacterium]|nr:zinc ribbon domain-containing protein [Bryobacteraceae bacterium]MDW8131117.1 zinc ribbon domain-containing protein [Bryobacterales bacterium]